VKRLLAGAVAAILAGWSPASAQPPPSASAAAAQQGSAWFGRAGVFWELDWTTPAVDQASPRVTIRPSPRLGGAVSVGRWISLRMSVQGDVEIPQRRTVDVRRPAEGPIEKQSTYRSEFFGASFSFHPTSMPLRTTFSAGMGALRQVQQWTVGGPYIHINWAPALSVGADASFRVWKFVDAAFGLHLLLPLGIQERGPGVLLRPSAAVGASWRAAPPRAAWPALSRRWFVAADLFVPVLPLAYPDVGTQTSTFYTTTSTASSQYRPGLRIGGGRLLTPRSSFAIEYEVEPPHMLTRDTLFVPTGSVHTYHFTSRTDLLSILLTYAFPVRGSQLEFASGLGVRRGVGAAQQADPPEPASDTTHHAALVVGARWGWPFGRGFEGNASLRLAFPLGMRQAIVRPGVGVRWRF